MKLSIIIPCKNEEKYIGKLLESLTKESLPSGTEIIIADANSTDDTFAIIHSYMDRDRLPIQIIEGGLPSVGRNLGAKKSTGDILLFLDSDCYFKEPGIINSSLKKMDNNELVGCLLNIENNLLVRVIYFFCNMVIRLSKYDKPFVVGTYMMIKRGAFERVGGFDESLMHCEDYFLSKEISGSQFSVINRYVYTDDRRFKKVGFLNMVLYFTGNIFRRNNREYFKKDIGYWL